jgi:integrase
MLRLVRRARSPNWIIRGTVRGIRVEESTGTPKRRVAEEIRAKRESELLTQSVYGRRAACTFAEAALSYIEGGGSKRFLEPVVRYFETTPLARIDQEAIERGARKTYPGTSNATLDRQFFTPASAVLKHAAKRGWCAPLILERPAVSPPPIRWLTLEEANRLIEACGDHLRPLVVFMIYTGARAGEALWLDWRHVDLARRHVVFPKTKNGEARGVPLHDRALVALANLPHREGEVFRRPDGLPYERPKHPDDTSAGSRIKRAFAGACSRAGIKDFSGHGCRHTWATLALRGEPRRERPHAARRLENGFDGDALRARERGRAPAHDRSSTRGDFRGRRKEQGKIAMTDHRHSYARRSPSHGRGRRFNPYSAHQPSLPRSYGWQASPCTSQLRLASQPVHLPAKQRRLPVEARRAKTG